MYYKYIVFKQKVMANTEMLLLTLTIKLRSIDGASFKGTTHSRL